MAKKGYLVSAYRSIKDPDKLGAVIKEAVAVVRSGQPHRFEAINPGGLQPL